MTKSFTTLPQMIEYVHKNFNNSCALGYKENGAWQKISTQDFYASVTNLALGLIDLGVKKGDKIGIMAPPSPFWIIMDQAILSLGCISVPLFPNVSFGNLKYEIEESEMKYLYISGPEQWEIVKPHREHFKRVIVHRKIEGDNLLIDFASLESNGSKLNASNPKAFSALEKPSPEDLATIIYTSGSTGVPKGAEISHRNLISQIIGIEQLFPLDSKNDICLSALPLAHVFERVVSMYYLSQGVSIYFAEDIKKIGDNLRELSPTMVTMVPRLLEKVFAKMQANVNAGHGIKKVLATAAFKRAVSRNSESPATLKDKIFDKLVYVKMRAALGGKLNYVICGSAALSTPLNNFFLNIGIPLYEGYGCTETSPVISCNYPGNRKVGTIGKAFPGVQVKIAADKEILAKGPNVMRCYFKKPQETSEAIDSEGFYHTGDLGSLDADNYLRITGRKKELFKTVNGKYVAPVPIENALINKSKIVDLAMIIGENKKFVTIIIFPDMENLPAIKASMNLSQLSNEDFFKSTEVKQSLQGTIDEINKDLNKWEQIQKFTIANAPISPESGELTPSMKIRRHIIEEKFKSLIDAMYAE